MAAARARITPASTIPWPPKPLILISFLLATVSLQLGLGQVVQPLDNLGALGVHKLAPGLLACLLLGGHLVELLLADEGLLHPLHHFQVVSQLVGAAIVGGALGDDLKEAEALLRDCLLDHVDAGPRVGGGGPGHVGCTRRRYQLTP